MWEHLKVFFDTTMFAPHGLCLLWDPELLLIHIASDAVIAISYFSIPFALTYFVLRRRDLEFGWVFWAFALFITACGFTHVFSILTLWVPVYGLEGIIKALTAAASVITAILLWPLIPKLLSVPSPGQLRLAHSMLEAEAKQRRDAEAMLSHSQKMEAIGQLTGGIAHDFNNLLTVVAGNLEIAQRALVRLDQHSTERISRAIESAYHGAQRAATLTQRLLAFARKQPLEAKIFNPSQTISGMVEFVRRTVGETIEVKIADEAKLWNVETDPTQFEAALLNLVVNARDAMKSGGTLTIETGNAFVDNQYAQQNGNVAAGPYVIISVKDTGTGMDAETAERAFEPFFSTKEVGQGTGLGLSQVYGFAKQSGGFATIHSQVGVGTSVNVFLPRSEGQIAASVECAEVPHPEHGDGETVLVTEDDDAIRNYVVEMLDGLNYRVVEARNAAEAIEVFKRMGHTIDLLLTDVVMPGANGRVLSQELVRLKPELKVLFMTGYSRDAIVHDGRLDPGVDLIQKPITQRSLADRVRRLLAGLRVEPFKRMQSGS